MPKHEIAAEAELRSATLINEASSLLNSVRYREAKAALLKTITEASDRLRQVKASPSTAEIRESYLSAIREFNGNRGRELYYPFLSSGLGSGPFVELADGSVKFDMITGIGVNFFGHSHPELVAEMIDGLGADVQQGNLEPGIEARELLRVLIPRAARGSRLKHAWLTTCGTMANEIGLKIIRQKRAPATKILAFQDCFSGRSTAMQEITDNPKYREGQPVYGEVSYLPFYDSKLPLDRNISRTLETMKGHLDRYPGKFAALMLELVQGEGGFNFAPREWYVRVFEEAKKAGLAIWADEVQTFGRTGELFAFQTFDLGQYVDVVSVGKMLQACAVFYTEEYNPKPGLVAGTFAGATVALRTARRTLELLDQQGFLGEGGRIRQLSERFHRALEKLSHGSCQGQISDIRVLGGMIAFQALGGSMDDAKAVLMKLFDLGCVAFYCGHGPYLIRMLPPLGAMTEQDIDQVCGLIEKAVLAAKEARKA